MAKTDTSNLARLASNIGNAYDKVIATTKEGEVANAIGDALTAGAQGFSAGLDIDNKLESNKNAQLQNEFLSATNQSNIAATNAENQTRTTMAGVLNDSWETIGQDRSLSKAAGNKNPMTRQ